MFRIWLRIIFVRADRKNFLRFLEVYFRKMDQDWGKALRAFEAQAEIWLEQGRPFDCQVVTARGDHPVAGWYLGRLWEGGPHLALSLESELYYSYRKLKVSRWWLLITKRGGEHLPCLRSARWVNRRYLRQHQVAVAELRHIYGRIQEE